MTMTNARCWLWARGSELALTALLLFSDFVLAAEPSDSRSLSVSIAVTEPLPADALDLFLEVSLNEVPTGQLAHVLQHEGRLWATAETLRELGLRVEQEASTNLALDALPGMLVDYDIARQRLNLQAPVALLDRPVMHYFGQDQDYTAPLEADAPLRGLTFNYDIYAQHGDSRYTLSALQELRLSGFGPGIWSNTMTSRRSGDSSGASHDSVRLDSSWFIDFPASMHSLTVGDNLTGALPWSRSTRIGGIRLSRNFALQPQRVTAPLVLFQGEAALPSTVDLYINGLRQSSQEVQPGQFEISSAPSLNGLGEAQMLITDMNGQQRSVEFSMYGVPRLLQAGIADYSLELGAVRRAYGTRSFDYDDAPMLSGTWRYGMSDATTLEAHAEATSQLQLLGGGGNWRLGTRGGVLNLALAASTIQGQHGEQLALGYQWNSRFFNFSFNSQRRARAYRDVASLHGARLSRSSDQLFLGTNSSWGNFGLSYVQQQDFENRPSRFVNLSWFRSLARSASINFSAIRDLDDNSGTTFTLSFMLPLGRYQQVGSNLRQRDGDTTVSTSLTRRMPVDAGGWGWRVEAVTGADRTLRAQASRLGNYGQWQAGFSSREGGGTSSYAGFDGGLLWTGKRVYAMRKVEDAFTLVSTGGVAGVPVKLENRLVGTTNAQGLLLVNRLNAYQRNQLSIDTMQLPANMHVGAVTLDAVPERRSGVLTQFELRRVITAQGMVQDRNGQPLPVGSRLYLEATAGAEQAVVIGHEGFVYLEDPATGAAFRGMTALGECNGRLPAELSEEEVMLDLGVLVCE